MNQHEIDETLRDLRNYANAVRYEWENKNPAWIPSWVEKFQAIDTEMTEGYMVPTAWQTAIRSEFDMQSLADKKPATVVKMEALLKGQSNRFKLLWFGSMTVAAILLVVAFTL